MDTCRRCGEPLAEGIEVCRACGKWRHGISLIVAGAVAVVLSMLVAWFVFANTF